MNPEIRQIKADSGESIVGLHNLAIEKLLIQLKWEDFNAMITLNWDLKQISQICCKVNREAPRLLLWSVWNRNEISQITLHMAENSCMHVPLHCLQIYAFCKGKTWKQTECWLTLKMILWLALGKVTRAELLVAKSPSNYLLMVQSHFPW